MCQRNRLKKKLEEVTYGFILRHDIEVNRVATPTKISSYLSAGVLPIYSSCLKDFHANASGKSFAFALNPGQDLDGLANYINEEKDKNSVQKEIQDLFDTYYSVENHVKNIVALSDGILK